MGSYTPRRRLPLVYRTPNKKGSSFEEPLLFSAWFKIFYDIIICVATPRQAQKGGAFLELLISFLVSVVASVTAYYICKWLDRDDNGNEPKE